ncbi:MAG: hypothetical protein ABI794_10580 [Betaproteobacteria bacterium]
MNIAYRNVLNQRRPIMMVQPKRQPWWERVNRGPLYGMLIVVASGTMTLSFAIWILRHVLH